MSPISPATLRALLAALGFRPIAHTILTAETLGWSERVAVDLRGRAFALLADADDGYFQVLLLLPQAGAAELGCRHWASLRLNPRPRCAGCLAGWPRRSRRAGWAIPRKHTVMSCRL